MNLRELNKKARYTFRRNEMLFYCSAAFIGYILSITGFLRPSSGARFPNRIMGEAGLAIFIVAILKTLHRKPKRLTDSILMLHIYGASEADESEMSPRTLRKAISLFKKNKPDLKESEVSSDALKNLTIPLFENYDQYARKEMDFIGFRNYPYNKLTKVYILMFEEILSESEPFAAIDQKEQNHLYLKTQKIICKYIQLIDSFHEPRSDVVLSNIYDYPIKAVSYERIENALEYLMSDDVYMNAKEELEFRNKLQNLRSFILNDLTFN